MTEPGAGVLLVKGLDAAHIGSVAAAHQLAIHELTAEQASLEEVFMEMTADAVDYHGTRVGGNPT